MKGLKITRNTCIVLLIAFAVKLVIHAKKCMGFHYPMPMMGSTAENWFDAFVFDVGFILMTGGFILLALIIGLLVYSCVKLKKLKIQTENNN